ncbi:hypothetical protein O181_037468 [Austropuccinia psidii MF-1]|uniref:Integrase catalytic domain-containing protein n=1 Tax=Austropuccinia psidii MF-1 TaxID=1389203 RepID=A0A9Q3HA46_9BASI|nr:hypothetical protein [Austropuccinia psidii MF-1]
MMIQIQAPKLPWEIDHMDWLAALPPGGDRSFHTCLVHFDRYSKTPRFLPCHKYDTAMDTVIMIWRRVISHTVLIQNIISDRDPKFTSAVTMRKVATPYSRCCIWNLKREVDGIQVGDRT